MKKIENISDVSGGNSLALTMIKSVIITTIIFEGVFISLDQCRKIEDSQGFLTGFNYGFKEGHDQAMSQAYQAINTAKTTAQQEFNSGSFHGYNIGYLDGLKDSM